MAVEVEAQGMAVRLVLVDMAVVEMGVDPELLVPLDLQILVAVAVAVEMAVLLLAVMVVQALLLLLIPVHNVEAVVPTLL
jgi:hypothetical protein